MLSSAQVIHKYWCMYGFWLKNTHHHHHHHSHFILAPRFWITYHDQITVLRWRWARTGCTNWSHRWYDAQCTYDDTSICSQYIWPSQLEQWTHGKNLAREESPCLCPACFLPPSSPPMRTAKDHQNRIINPSTRHPCICTPLPAMCIFSPEQSRWEVLPSSSQSQKRHALVPASSADKHASSMERQQWKPRQVQSASWTCSQWGKARERFCFGGREERDRVVRAPTRKALTNRRVIYHHTPTCNSNLTVCHLYFSCYLFTSAFSVSTLSFINPNVAFFNVYLPF